MLDRHCARHLRWILIAFTSTALSAQPQQQSGSAVPRNSPGATADRLGSNLLAKTTSRVIQEAKSAREQSVLVLLDDIDVRAETLRKREERGIRGYDSQLLEESRQALQRLRQKVLTDVAGPGLEVKEEYEHLPGAAVRLGSYDALERLLKHPGVLRVDEITRLSPH